MRFFRKYGMGLDIYERHAIVARLLTKSGSKSVLDVGGTAGMLQMFSSNLHVTTINIDGSGDLTYSGETLPFPDSSFDAVVSLDTLEHVPHGNRRGFIQELIRVAGNDVIFCAPLGTELHRNLEIELNEAWRRQFGEEHHFLKQHIDYVLPTLDEIKNMLSDREFELFFVGDFRLAACLFRNYMRAAAHRHLAVRRFSAYVNQFSTLFFCFIKINKEPSEFTNRVYAHLHKAS